MQIDTERIKKLRMEAEEAIADEVSGWTEKFASETGLSITSLRVSFIDASTFTKQHRIVNVAIDVEIPR